MSTLLIDYELLNRDRYTFSRHLDVQATSLDGPTVHVIEESEGERSVRISSFVGLSAPHELILRTLLVEPMAGRSTIQRRGALGRLTRPVPIQRASCLPPRTDRVHVSS